MGRPSSPDLLALHGLRLVGTAEPEAVAEYFGVPAAEIAEATARAAGAGLVVRHEGRFGGFRLTPAGRAEGEDRLAEELDVIGARPAFEEFHASFLPLNERLLEVCTRWQLRGKGAHAVVNEHDDPDYDVGVIAEVAALHDEAAPVLAGLVALFDRFAIHEHRLRYALDQVTSGEHDYLTKPMFPSYHSVWFELHEDLLATLGRERSTEGNN